MNERPDLHLYFMRMARLVATRSTCLRRAVGCVLVDARGHVLSTGYNGVAAGEQHCNDPGETLERIEDAIRYGASQGQYGENDFRNIGKGVHWRAIQTDRADEDLYVIDGWRRDDCDLVRSAFPNACPAARAAKGTQLEGCRAVHAEQNALLQCRDPHAVAVAYVTVAPCDSCLKLFLNTSCHTLVVGGWYFNSDGTSNEAHISQSWSGKKSPDGWAVRKLVFEDRT